VTTLALAKKGRRNNDPRAFFGSLLCFFAGALVCAGAEAQPPSPEGRVFMPYPLRAAIVKEWAESAAGASSDLGHESVVKELSAQVLPDSISFVGPTDVNFSLSQSSEVTLSVEVLLRNSASLPRRILISRFNVQGAPLVYLTLTDQDSHSLTEAGGYEPKELFPIPRLPSIAEMIVPAHAEVSIPGVLRLGHVKKKSRIRVQWQLNVGSRSLSGDVSTELKVP
jgi:hypothetical protein